MKNKEKNTSHVPYMMRNLERNQHVANIIMLSQSYQHKEKGYGRCSYSGCICPEYAGSGPLCTNCGHNYDTHW